MSSRLAPRIIVPLAVLFAAGLVASYLVGTRPEARPNPPAEKIRPVKVLSAHYETITPELLVYGEIASGREAEIRSMVAGRLVFLDPAYRSGSYIEAGSRLATVDPFEYELAVREQQADLLEARAKLRELSAELDAERQLLGLLDEQIELRRRDLDRVANLVKKNQVTEKAYDDAKLVLNVARQQRLQGGQSVEVLSARIEQQQAAIARGEAELQRAQRDVTDTEISAPFSGFLHDVVVATGKRVAVGESIGRLIDVDGLEVRFQLPNADYARLVGATPGSSGSASHPLADTKIRASWRLGRDVYTYLGLIDRAGAEIDSSGGGVVLFARIIEGPLGILRPGAFVEISIPDVTYENVLVIPEAAVSDDGVVYVVEGARLAAREVEVVRERGDTLFVRSDIDPKTEIVVERFPDIGPGIRVQPM